MKVQPLIVPMMQVPDGQQAGAAIEQARAMFRRTLAGWASDLLCLRRAGLIRPAWRGPAESRPAA